MGGCVLRGGFGKRNVRGFDLFEFDEENSSYFMYFGYKVFKIELGVL